MNDHLVWLPLGQMNTTPGTNPAVESRTTAGAPAASVGPAAPVAGTTTGAGATVGTVPATSSATEPDAGKAAPGNPLTGMILPIILMFVVLYFVMFRGQRKEEKRRKNLIADLKKGDRVMTIGGLMARVVSIDGDEVVLKVDESANVKATYRKSAIQEVLTGDEKK